MPSIVKVKSNEEAITTETTVSSARVVRVYAPSDALITVQDVSANTVIGTFTIPGGRVDYVEKRPDDTISSNTTVYGVSVSFNT